MSLILVLSKTVESFMLKKYVVKHTFFFVTYKIFIVHLPRFKDNST